MDCTCQNCMAPIVTTYEEKLKVLALGKKMKEYKKSLKRSSQSATKRLSKDSKDILSNILSSAVLLKTTSATKEYFMKLSLNVFSPL